MKYVATVGGEPTVVDVSGGEGGRYRVTLGDEVWEVDARLESGIASLLVNGASYVVAFADRDGALVVDVGGDSYEVLVEERTRWTIRTRGGAAGAGRGQTLSAPLPGKITHVAVQPGATVKAGDTLVVIEAMKMENEFKATAAGTVAEVRVSPGQAVNPGDVLVVIE